MHLHRAGVTLLAAFALLVMEADPATGQIRASERAAVSQTVDGTVIEVDYARPRLRGRSPIFGKVVGWDEVWTPGANEATRLTVSRDVTIEGRPVPEGSWSVWMVVAPGDTWELVLDPRSDLWHTVHPGPTDDQIRFPVAAHPVRDGPEVLTWSFPAYSTGEATLQMAWAGRRVPMTIEVEPSMRRTVEPDEAAPFVGTYGFAFEPVPGLAPEGTEPVPLEVRYDEETSRLTATTSFPGEGWPDPMILLLQPMAEGVFMPGMMVDGQLVESLPAHLEFLYGADGAVAGFEMRGVADDRLLATGSAGS